MHCQTGVTGYLILNLERFKEKEMTSRVGELIVPLLFRNSTSSSSLLPPLSDSSGRPRGQDTLFLSLFDAAASCFLGLATGGDLEESEAILGEVGSAKTTLNRSPDDTDVIFRP